MDDTLGWRPRLRILCLHGRCQTAATFERKLGKLASKASSFAEFVLVDGPVELSLQHGERVNTRGWWPDGAGRAGDDADVRATLVSAWARLGPFDGVLGFSEGAAAALVLCGRSAAAAAGREAADCDALAGLGLRFAVLVGSPGAPSGLPEGGPLTLPSLHVLSDADNVVPAAESRRLATEAFEGATLLEHEGGHSLPQRAEDIRQVADFLQRMREVVYPREFAGACVDVLGDCAEQDQCVPAEQREELETLAAVYPDELARIAPRWPVRLALGFSGGRGSLRFLLPPGYPQFAACACEVASEDAGVAAHATDILAAADEERGPPGFPSVLAMFQAAQQWIDDHEDDMKARAAEAGGGASAPSAEPGGDGEDHEDGAAAASAWWLRDDEDEVDDGPLRAADARAAELLPDEGSSALARACGAGRYGRPWQFVVGLVGKPSAGKSTLFNAATRPEHAEQEASMAPHPFTTIDPNVGTGWFAAPCPMTELREHLGGAVPEPEHGAAPGGHRRMPLLVKDVAGLVPGAYLGRGRGNAFLNDLCDSDSLVHVVDASGRSDSEGVDQGSSSPGAASDPLDEVGWVRREIHLWVFCNVRAKWDTVRKKARMATTHALRENLADRLFGLFTGYHASKQLVTQVYEAAGFSLVGMAEAVMQWTEYDLHLLVACFLRARFPIVVALNKADVPGASARVARAREALGSGCVAVSARSEWWLYDQQRKGNLRYEQGAGADMVDVALSAPAAVQEEFARIKATILEPFSCTGVLEVLSRAVQRRRPLYVCPVSDVNTCEALPRAPAAGCARPAGPPAPLHTMVLLRPLSTVDEAFAALGHEGMVRGDLVRAELLTDPASRSVKVLKRDETLRAGAAGGAIVLRAVTNKKCR